MNCTALEQRVMKQKGQRRNFFKKYFKPFLSEICSFEGGNFFSLSQTSFFLASVHFKALGECSMAQWSVNFVQYSAVLGLIPGIYK